MSGLYGRKLLWLYSQRTLWIDGIEDVGHDTGYRIPPSADLLEKQLRSGIIKSASCTTHHQRHLTWHSRWIPNGENLRKLQLRERVSNQSRFPRRHLNLRHVLQGQGYIWGSPTRFLPDREVEVGNALRDWVELSRRGQGCEACSCNSTTILHVPLHLHNTASPIPDSPRSLFYTSHCLLSYAFPPSIFRSVRTTASSSVSECLSRRFSLVLHTCHALLLLTPSDSPPPTLSPRDIMDKQAPAAASASSPRPEDVTAQHVTPQSSSAPASQGPSSQEQQPSSQLQDQSSSPPDLERHPKGKRKRTAYVDPVWPQLVALYAKISRPQCEGQVHSRSRVPCQPETRQGGASRDREPRFAEREGGPSQYCHII